MDYQQNSLTVSGNVHELNVKSVISNAQIKTSQQRHSTIGCDYL